MAFPLDSARLPALTPAPAADLLERDTYWTDGHHLFRAVRTLRLAGRDFAELEDCRTLELVLVSGQQLARARLRPVRATG